MSVFASFVKRFERLQTSAREVNQVQERIEKAFNPLASMPLLQGVLLTDVLLTVGYGNQVQHGLEREPMGFILCGSNTYATVCENVDNRTDKVIELNTTATATVNLWVF